jgi:RES domain-containing protein
MQMFRLCSSRYQATAFSGTGASLAGGRWNYRGESVVYLGGTLALTALECLVHFSNQTLPGDYVCLTVTVPKNIKIKTIDPTTLATEWWQEDPPVSTQALGSEWLQSKSSVLLRVPSAIIPTEFNYLLNPQHKDFSKVSIAPATEFRFDPRLKT